MAVTYGSGGDITVSLEGPFGSMGSMVQVAELTLPAQNWKGGQSPYFQSLTPEGISSFTKVDLLPSHQQLEAFRSRELALTTENDGGVLTVYAIGTKPDTDLILQAAFTEVKL